MVEYYPGFLSQNIPLLRNILFTFSQNPFLSTPAAKQVQLPSAYDAQSALIWDTHHLTFHQCVLEMSSDNASNHLTRLVTEKILLGSTFFFFSLPKSYDLCLKGKTLSPSFSLVGTWCPLSDPTFSRRTSARKITALRSQAHIRTPCSAFAFPSSASWVMIFFFSSKFS